MALLGLAFFLSGAAALVYQVVWQRILTLHTGIGVVSVSLIVASFMAGLGLGSQLGGVLSGRLRPRAALAAFALIELGVGLFAAVSCRLYHEGFGAVAAGSTGPPRARRSRTSRRSCVPTTLMGMSLPFLVRATVRETACASRVIAALYGVNVLGAATGALLAPWVLVRYLGMEGAVLLGALANLLAAAAALLTARRGLLEGARGRGAAAAEAPRPRRDPRVLRALLCSTASRASWRSRSRSCGSG